MEEKHTLILSSRKYGKSDHWANIIMQAQNFDLFQTGALLSRIHEYINRMPLENLPKEEKEIAEVFRSEALKTVAYLKNKRLTEHGF